MFRYRRLLLAAVVLIAAATAIQNQAHAAFQIRVTQLSSGGVSEASATMNFPVAGPGDTISFNFATMLPNWTGNIVSNVSTTGAGFSSHDTTNSLTYSGADLSKKLLIEILGDSYTNPTAGAISTITSSGSTTGTASGLRYTSVIYTSGVINGNVSLSGTPGTTLGGQMGMTTNTGLLTGAGSTNFAPNPTAGAPFAISNPFTFYQTFLISGVTRRGSGTTSGSSEVDGVLAAPAPPALVMALCGMPAVFGYTWLRRRAATKVA